MDRQRGHAGPRKREMIRAVERPADVGFVNNGERFELRGSLEHCPERGTVDPERIDVPGGAAYVGDVEVEHGGRAPERYQRARDVRLAPEQPTLFSRRRDEQQRASRSCLNCSSVQDPRTTSPGYVALSVVWIRSAPSAARRAASSSL